jgi:Zn finger protein HypA/HybF involved in hydrogenase expression
MIQVYNNRLLDEKTEKKVKCSECGKTKIISKDKLIIFCPVCLIEMEEIHG